MSYFGQTYLAGAWDEDHDAIEQLISWKNNHYLSLNFNNVHDLKQSRDTSLACSIKQSLSERMDMCELFALIVSSKTMVVNKGSCRYCKNYVSENYCRVLSKTPVNKSFIEFECDKARKAFDEFRMKIIVLYNSCEVNQSYCPEVLREIGCHVAMKDVYGHFDYNKVKNAFENV